MVFILESSEESRNEYDFIVVGGGTAGLTIAARLSECPQAKILVLEAGENALDNPQVKTPGLWAALLGSDYDWDFETVPQVRPLTFCRLPRQQLCQRMD